MYFSVYIITNYAPVGNFIRGRVGETPGWDRSPEGNPVPHPIPLPFILERKQFTVCFPFMHVPCPFFGELQCAAIVNRGKWLGMPVNIKEVNKQVKIYVGRFLTLHSVCSMIIDNA